MIKSYIVIHHSATADGQTFNTSAIWDYHVKTKGWTTVGYNILTEKVGNRIMSILGRPFDQDGAHCTSMDMNKKSIGHCCVGNYDIEVPTIELLNEVKARCLWNMKLYGIHTANVIGHHEAQIMAGMAPGDKDWKTCPGKLFNMDKFRESLLKELPVV